jgi:Domain of unknown function (DU1801)
MKGAMRKNLVSEKTKRAMTEEARIDIDPEVKAVFDSYPPEVRAKLLFLRALILGTAAALEGVGEIEETIKWGEPSYLTPASKSGSTVRIAWKPAQEEQYSMFFKCTANLVPAFKERFPQEFDYVGDRSINFGLDDEVPVSALKQCIGLALTYHLNKKLEAADRWAMVEKVA